ncbi:MAG: NAD-dependent epimerase/dehydratase family protein [Thermodesulfobacteriota bacterium]
MSIEPFAVNRRCEKLDLLPELRQRDGCHVRALVLGGAGFLGRHVAARLHASGWMVRVLDRSWPKAGATLPAGVDGVAADVLDDLAVARAAEGADAVFHAAGTTDLATLQRAAASSVDAIVRATAHVSRRLALAGVRRLVCLSSGGTVYGQPRVVPISETETTRPISAHGRLSLALEDAIAAQVSRTVILRVANAYGPGQRTDRGQGLVGIACERLARGDAVEVFGSGAAVRDYVHVCDVADAAVRAAAYDGREHVFNVGTGHGTSVRALLGMIAERLDVPLQTRHVPARPFDVTSNVLDVARARHELGWMPRVSIEAGIADLAGRVRERAR